MRHCKTLTWTLILAMTASLCGCAKTVETESETETIESSVMESETESESTKPETTEPEPSFSATRTDIVDMTMLICSSDSRLSMTNGKEKVNTIRELIAEKTGVRVEEEYADYNAFQENIQAGIESGDLPDFVYNIDGYYQFADSNCLVAWDDYIEQYPNIKDLFTDEEWDSFRKDDGKIYMIELADKHYTTDTTPVHDGFAFWIQARVLEEYGYPKITTLDEYFDILDKFAQEHPALPNGTSVIPYTCLCEDWKYYCLESAPMFLDGYPNYDNCIVNIDEGVMDPKVEDYNTSDTAKEYFRKLNEEYKKGNIDPDFASMTYDEYISKLSTGCVLGFADQYWDFSFNLKNSFDSELTGTDGNTFTLSDIGCDYVPLALTAKANMRQRYHIYGDTLGESAYFGVTTACSDPDLAFSFLNDLLDQEIHNLRFWGMEGSDYLVNETGEFYRTEAMREKFEDEGFKARHVCEYAYMPQWKGMSRDGINRMQPSEQPSEYLATLSEPLRRCFEAYGAGNYVDMLGSVNGESYPWYSTLSSTNLMIPDTPGSQAKAGMETVKHKWLPTLVTSSDFESDWTSYMEEYEATNPQAYFDEVQVWVDSALEETVNNGWSGE